MKAFVIIMMVTFAIKGLIKFAHLWYSDFPVTKLIDRGEYKVQLFWCIVIIIWGAILLIPRI